MRIITVTYTLILFCFFNSSFSATLTWNGSVDNDWHKACNWTPSTNVPQCTDDVIIPNGLATYPDVTANACAASVTINAGVPTGGLDIQTTGQLRINTGGIDIIATAANVVSILGAGTMDFGLTNTPTDNGGCITYYWAFVSDWTRASNTSVATRNNDCDNRGDLILEPGPTKPG